MPLLGVTSIIYAGINFMCQPDRWNIFKEDRNRRHKCYFSNLPRVLSMHAGIYWLTENVTTCMVIFHIGIYGIIYSATVAV